jgi:hypothetical protein
MEADVACLEASSFKYTRPMPKHKLADRNHYEIDIMLSKGAVEVPRTFSRSARTGWS